jgi:hypothetical protein
MTGPLHVQPLDGGRYRVTGGRAPHVVTIDLTVASCDCADRHYRRRRCKHLTAVIDFLLAGPPRDATRSSALESFGPGLERDVPPPDRAA